MLIPSQHFLDKGMNVTINDIWEKRAELEQKKALRKHRLQSDAVSLVEELKSSLGVSDGNNKTADINGVPLPYVRTYVVNSQRNLEERPVQAVQLNNNHQICFVVGVLAGNDEPGGTWVNIEVEMWYETPTELIVNLPGYKPKHLKVTGQNVGGKFYESAALIKQTCIEKLSDSRLD